MSRYDARPSARLLVASLGDGLTTRPELAAWSVQRALSGGSLPGQARAASGSALASGNADVLPLEPVLIDERFNFVYNPSFEIGDTRGFSWTSGITGVQVVSTAAAVTQGGRAGRVTLAANAPAWTYMQMIINPLAAPGQWLTGQISVGGAACSFVVRVTFTSGGFQVGTVQTGAYVTTTANTMKIVNLPVCQIPDGADKAFVQLYPTGSATAITAPGVTTFNTDAWLVVAERSQTDAAVAAERYWDGDTLSTDPALVYGWVGTPGSSWSYQRRYSAQPVSATPWSRAIRPGGIATLSASEDGGALLPLGTFQVRGVTGAGARTNQRTLDLEDPIGLLANRSNIGAVLSTRAATQIDAAWLIDTMARAAGYYSSPPPSKTTLLSAPLRGSTDAEAGYVDPLSTGAWTTDATEGVVYPEGGTINAKPTTEFPLAVGTTLFLRMEKHSNSAAVNFIVWSYAPLVQELYVHWWADTGVVNVIWQYGQAANQQAVLRLPVTARRVFLRMTITSSSAAASAQGDTLVIDAVTDVSLATTTDDVRATDLGPFTTPGVVTTTTATRAAGRSLDEGSDGALIRTINIDGPAGGVQFDTSSTGISRWWTQPTARVAAARSTLSAVFVDPTASAWQLMQDIAAATLGAVWVAEDGVLTYRSRDQLRGAMARTETIVAMESLEDVPWEMNLSDVADRVEVSYSPVTVQVVSNYSLTAWEVADPILVPARKTITQDIQLDGVAVANVAPFLPVWSTAQPANTYSRWAANPNVDGGGTRPADNALSITAQVINPALVRLRITNNTGTDLYTFDGNSTSTIIIRANAVGTAASDPIVVARGATADDAIAPLSVDLAAYVQNADTAAEIADWLAGQTVEASPVLSGMRVVPKMSRRLGDVVLVTEPYTGLRSKALITSLDTSGAPEGIQQSVTLTLLDVLVWDVDQWASTNGTSARQVQTVDGMAVALASPTGSSSDTSVTVAQVEAALNVAALG